MKNRNRLRAWMMLPFLVAGCTCGEPPAKDTLKPEGVACGADSECETGLCDALPGGEKLCMRKCTAGCRQLEVCTQLALDRYGCVPERAGLCEPCQSDDDCPYPADRCIALGAEKFCGRDCSFDGTCPFSFRCAEATTPDGVLVASQCQPNSGTCQCTALTGGQELPCEETNNLGTCTGVKVCEPPGGYSACSARVPAAEVCNGQDDDCNGQVDENLGDTACGLGECTRTVANCANGQSQQCQPGDAGVEACNEKDDDCDGVTDNGFDKLTDLQHCGACNNPCAPPNANPVCFDGGCAIASCLTGHWDIDKAVPNGCEYPCNLTNGGTEACDGVDNDCDMQTDETFDLNTDPQNCGACGFACNVANGNVATYKCTVKVCGVDTCVSGFGDCDQQYATGCETNTNTSVLHCGGCNRPCSLANATPACSNGGCVISACTPPFRDCNLVAADGCEVNTSSDVNHCGACNSPCSRPFSNATCVNSTCNFTCQTDRWDVDQNPANGCEYFCVFQSATDLPDIQFIDANCDGIDGDVSRAIFVDVVSGNDSNAGTRSAPKRTIGAGILAANAGTPTKDVYISRGTYSEAVTLLGGISLFGGYDAANGWSRATTNTTSIVSPTAVGVRAVNLGLATEVQLLSITAADATGTAANGDGNSSFGILAVDASGGLTVRNCTITAGRGSSGSTGLNGSTGTSGNPGGPAGQGGVMNRGAAGTSSCGAPGGQGGQGVDGEINGSPGSPGTTASGGGSGGPAGSGGARGTCSSTSSSNGNPAPPLGSGGGTGSPGSNGTAGANFGTFDAAGVYLPPTGLSGSAGNPGGGGGGGGAGGGTAHGTNFFCTNCSGIASGGGGGGGGGGCGGNGGNGGRGGGGSFGITSINSAVTVLNTTLTSRNAGNGGAGGNGGFGGNGGGGGSGSVGETESSSCSTRSGGRGADGAGGGVGGRGGGGAGGSGGPSICIVYKGSAPTTSANSCTNGTPGSGGFGGTNGLQPAATGTTGITQALQQAL
ncbi:MAG: MopE-related protein [Myxococcota bacterium]